MSLSTQQYVELEPLDDFGTESRAFGPSNAFGLLITDAHLKVMSADRMFLDLFGIAAENVVGKDVGKVLGHEGLHDDLLAVLLFDTPLENHLVPACMPGVPGCRMLKISASSVRLEGLDERDGLFISIEDVTP